MCISVLRSPGGVHPLFDVPRAHCHWWLHLQADEAHRLGPSLASQSYLRGDIVLNIAKRTGAQVRVAAWLGADRWCSALLAAFQRAVGTLGECRAFTRATVSSPKTPALQRPVLRTASCSLDRRRRRLT